MMDHTNGFSDGMKPKELNYKNVHIITLRIGLW